MPWSYPRRPLEKIHLKSLKLGEPPMILLNNYYYQGWLYKLNLSIMKSTTIHRLPRKFGKWMDKWKKLRNLKKTMEICIKSSVGLTTMGKNMKLITGPLKMDLSINAINGKIMMAAFISHTKSQSWMDQSPKSTSRKIKMDKSWKLTTTSQPFVLKKFLWFCIITLEKAWEESDMLLVVLWGVSRGTDWYTYLNYLFNWFI